MGNLIFCEKPNTLRPYYVENLGVNLYSGEELCYYIYNNLMLIDVSFFDERLYQFISSIGYEELSSELQNSRDSYDYKNLLLLILKTIRYYSDDEIARFKQEIDRITSVGASKVLKEKADHLFESNRMYEAIKMYEKVLSTKGVSAEDVKADVYRSLGNAHARLFSYNHAIEYYLKAYEISGDINNLRSIYFIHLISDASAYPKELFDEIDKKTLSLWDEDYHRTVTAARSDDEVLEIENILDDVNTSKRTGVLKFITIWKSEFKKIF